MKDVSTPCASGSVYMDGRKVCVCLVGAWEFVNISGDDACVERALHLHFVRMANSHRDVCSVQEAEVPCAPMAGKRVLVVIVAPEKVSAHITNRRAGVSCAEELAFACTKDACQTAENANLRPCRQVL